MQHEILSKMGRKSLVQRVAIANGRQQPKAGHFFLNTLQVWLLNNFISFLNFPDMLKLFPDMLMLRLCYTIIEIGMMGNRGLPCHFIYFFIKKKKLL